MWARAGIVIARSYEHGKGERGFEFTFKNFWISLRAWMVAIVFGALPSWRGFVWWRAVRQERLAGRAGRAGRCGICGYDLRASPQRCPECGTAVGEKDHDEVADPRRRFILAAMHEA